MLFLLCLIKLKLLYSFLSIISALDYNSHSFLSLLLFFYWLYNPEGQDILSYVTWTLVLSISKKLVCILHAQFEKMIKWSPVLASFASHLSFSNPPLFHPEITFSLFSFVLLSSLLPMRVPSSGDADVLLTRASVCHLTSQAQCLPGALQIRLSI